ncbi:MAG: ABC transporter substrate-binding protein [Brevundimonas sp.]|nr:MAG: ABC transporter substrate-binding protein [Brevundimonas sp.]
MSLDQCADQYVLALRPDADLHLSPRADDPDAYLRAEARGRPKVRPTLETALALQPQVVVRYWGGDARMMARLDQSGARTVTIEDASDLDGIRKNIRAVAAALDAAPRGEALIARMDRTPPRAPRGQSALYLTAGGFTAGSGTLIDTLIRRAGFDNAVTEPFFQPVGMERLILQPPARLVLGFFEQARSDWRGVGRHSALRGLFAARPVTRWPAAVLTCPAWFSADASERLAGA